MAMLFNNGSLSIWGFEFEIGVLDYLMNIDEKFIFVKKFDVIDVFELIEKDLGLFWILGFSFRFCRSLFIIIS